MEPAVGLREGLGGGEMTFALRINLKHRAGFFRVFGYGLRVIRHRPYGPVFSERYADRVKPRLYYFHIGNYCIGTLRPERKVRTELAG